MSDLEDYQQSLRGRAAPIGGDPMVRPFAFFEWLTEALPDDLTGPDLADVFDAQLARAAHETAEAGTWAENDLNAICDSLRRGGIEPTTATYSRRIGQHLSRWLAYRLRIGHPVQHIAEELLAAYEEPKP